MNLSKFLIFGLFVFLSILLVSANFNCEQKKEQEKLAYGLELNWIEGAPPESVSINEPFSVYLELNNGLKNKIEAGDLVIYLKGVSPYLQGLNTRYLVDTDLAAGTKQLLKLSESVKWIQQLEEPFSFDLQPSTCYTYSFTKQFPVCIAKNQDTCTYTSKEFKDELVGVSIRETTEGKKLKLLIHLSNVGKGKVFRPEADCDKLFVKDLDEMLKADQVEFKLACAEFTCLLKTTEGYKSSKQGIADLGLVECEMPLSEQNYEAPCTLQVSFTYWQDFSKKTVLVLAE